MNMVSLYKTTNILLGQMQYIAYKGCNEMHIQISNMVMINNCNSVKI